MAQPAEDISMTQLGYWEGSYTQCIGYRLLSLLPHLTLSHTKQLQ